MLLQEADNFFLGTEIVSRLYMGETLVWPIPSGNLWQFLDNPSCKTLSNFRVVYDNGNVFADWGDGNTSGISSNINYNHTFQPCSSLIAITLYTENICRTTVPPVEAILHCYSNCSDPFIIGCKLYANSIGTQFIPDGPYSDTAASRTLTVLNGDVIFTGFCISS